MSTQSKWLWAVGILAAAAALLAFGVAMQNVLLIGLVLLCPAMMFFMGKNMHKGSGKDEPGAPSDTPHAGSDRASRQE